MLVDKRDHFGRRSMRLPTRLSGEDLWFEILLIDDAGAASSGSDYEQTLSFRVNIRFLLRSQPGHRPIDCFVFRDNGAYGS